MMTPRQFTARVQDLQIKAAETALAEQQLRVARAQAELEKAQHEAAAARVQAEIAEAQKDATLRALAEYKPPKVTS